MHKPKERKLPEGGDGGERKGKMAADIEYSTKLVDRDNQILDERMFEAFRLGAQFGPEDKRVRRGSHHAKTNNSKQSRAKKEEMMTESGVRGSYHWFCTSTCHTTSCGARQWSPKNGPMTRPPRSTRASVVL